MAKNTKSPLSSNRTTNPASRRDRGKKVKPKYSRPSPVPYTITTSAAGVLKHHSRGSTSCSTRYGIAVTNTQPNCRIPKCDGPVVFFAARCASASPAQPPAYSNMVARARNAGSGSRAQSPVTLFRAAKCNSGKPPNHKISRNSPVKSSGRAQSKAVPRRFSSRRRTQRSPKGVAATNTLPNANAVNVASRIT